MSYGGRREHMHDQSNPMEGTRGAIVAMTKIGSHP
jgi:hypothetical protein